MALLHAARYNNDARHFVIFGRAQRMPWCLQCNLVLRYRLNCQFNMLNRITAYGSAKRTRHCKIITLFIIIWKYYNLIWPCIFFCITNSNYKEEYAWLIQTIIFSDFSELFISFAVSEKNEISVTYDRCYEAERNAQLVTFVQMPSDVSVTRCFSKWNEKELKPIMTLAQFFRTGFGRILVKSFRPLNSQWFTN